MGVPRIIQARSYGKCGSADRQVGCHRGECSVGSSDSGPVRHAVEFVLDSAGVNAGPIILAQLLIIHSIARAKLCVPLVYYYSTSEG